VPLPFRAAGLPPVGATASGDTYLILLLRLLLLVLRALLLRRCGR
jgi:hypothetical protein